MTTTTDSRTITGFLEEVASTSLAWMSRAACAGAPTPDLWFEGDAEWRAEARAICAECPVREQCLSHALASDEPWGVWGGKTKPQRSALKRGTAA